MIASHLRPTVFVLLFALLAVSRGEEKHQNAVCNLCHCVQSEIADSEYTAIECRNVRATLYQEFEWPADAETIKRIKFRDMQSSILPIIKFDKRINYVDFSDNTIKSIDKKSLLSLPLVEGISFANNSIDKLLPEMFQKTVQIKSLNFSSNLLEELPENIFDLLSSLESVDLSFNEFQVLSTKIIATLKNVRELSFRGNSIYTVDQSDLDDIKVESLDLSHNKLQFVQNSQFKSFVKLSWLDLSHNEIKDIRNDAFFDQDALTYLDLSDNHLKKMHLQLPMYLVWIAMRNNKLRKWPIEEVRPALKFVDLHNNSLETVNIKNYNHESLSMQELILSNNRLTELQHLPFVSHLDISYNKFTLVPNHVEQAYDRLDVSGNPITSISFPMSMVIEELIMNNLPKLQRITEDSFMFVHGRSKYNDSDNGYLSIQMNNCPLLSEIDPLAFKHVLFSNLDLSYNNLSRIPESLTNWSAIDGVINLQGNPLICDCDSQWMVTEILTKLYEKPEHQYLLEDLRCSNLNNVRLVRFYKHPMPYCGRPLQLRTAGFSDTTYSESSVSGMFVFRRASFSPWLIVGVCAVVVLALVVTGVLMAKEERRRANRKRVEMLFSDL